MTGIDPVADLVRRGADLVERQDIMVGARMNFGISQPADAGVLVAVIGDVNDEARRPARTYGFDGLMPPRPGLSFKSLCRIGACEVSSPPSSPCSQLHSWMTLLTCRCVSNACVHANFGKGGIFSAGPI